MTDFSTHETFAQFEFASTSAPHIAELLSRWETIATEDFECALLIASELEPDLAGTAAALRTPRLSAGTLARQPSVVAWSTVGARSALGVPSLAVDGGAIEFAPRYALTLERQADVLAREGLRVQRNDPWLRLAFGSSVEYESARVTEEAEAVLDEAFHLIETWSPEASSELQTICSELQLITDPNAPDRIVSFSDDTVPGALYVSVRKAGAFLPPAFVADSIIHEYRHQKLYLLQRSVPLLESDLPLVESPWRDDPRPPSGLFHAVFVFACLLDFWRHLDRAPEAGGVTREVVARELGTIEARLRRAIPILRSCDLTLAGTFLVDVLESRAFCETQHA